MKKNRDWSKFKSLLLVKTGKMFVCNESHNPWDPKAAIRPRDLNMGAVYLYYHREEAIFTTVC